MQILIIEGLDGKTALEYAINGHYSDAIRAFILLHPRLDMNKVESVQNRTTIKRVMIEAVEERGLLEQQRVYVLEADIDKVGKLWPQVSFVIRAIVGEYLTLLPTQEGEDQLQAWAKREKRDACICL